MGKSILCLGKYANNSYYIDQIGISVYSIEELCFCFQENVYLLEAQLMSNSLTDWIKRECELAELSNKLVGMMRKKCSFSSFVIVILQDTYYCDAKEISIIEESIESNSFQNEYEKKNNLAEYFIKKKKYLKAIYVYENIVKDISIDDIENKELLAKSYHNLGVSYSRFFDFEKAAECFEGAYYIMNKVESYIAFLLAKRMMLSEADYVSFIGESKKHYQVSMEVEYMVERVKKDYEDEATKLEIEEIVAYKNSSHASEYYNQVTDLISKWKKEYRQSVED